MPLSPRAQQVIEQLQAAGPPYSSFPPAEARARYAALRKPMAAAQEPVQEVREVYVDAVDRKLPARLYRPAADAMLSALVYFHGGGFVVGNLDVPDSLCRAIANAARVAVLSVDYRLAPEYPFPDAFDDAYDSVAWIIRESGNLGIDPALVAVGGDSAGGNLAAAVSLAALERREFQPHRQVLLYPVTDFTFDTNSYLEFGEGLNLTRDLMMWFAGHYLPRPEDARNPYAAPLRARNLSGLPPALVLTAEGDPLRDEGEAYAHRLRASGVSVTHRRFPGMIHGFATMLGVFAEADEAVRAIADHLQA